jgi:hypothetical protein
MKPKNEPNTEKLGPFSHEEVKTVMMAIGIGVVLGFAAIMVDEALPKHHKMSAIIQAIFKDIESRKKVTKSAYDMERPKRGFELTDP